MTMHGSVGPPSRLLSDRLDSGIGASRSITSLIASVEQRPTALLRSDARSVRVVRSRSDRFLARPVFSRDGGHEVVDSHTHNPHNFRYWTAVRDGCNCRFSGTSGSVLALEHGESEMRVLLSAI